MKATALLATLVLGILVAPLAAEAQQRRNMPLIGVLTPYSTPTALTPHRDLEAFAQGLRQLGYVEGQTIHLEYRFAENQWDRLPALAAELVHLKPDVLVTHTVQGVLAAQQATATIPIVMAAGGDLVQLGIVPSLARPGGNITGQILGSFELDGKRLELLKEAVPTLAHVAILVDPTGPIATHYPSVLEAEARVLGVQLQRVDSGTPEAISDALALIAHSGAEALMIQNNAMFHAHRQHILAFARTHRLPTVCGARTFAEAGCLMAYAPNLVEMFRRAAIFVDKILKGATPADLPLELPQKLELVLNLTTAEALGVTLPPTLLIQADEVIK